MLKKSLKVIICAYVLGVFVGSSAAAANAIPINDLIENSVEYDGQEITIEGEAIGEVLERDGYAWVNINDGGNAIGIWMTLDDAEKIKFFGDYKNRGDVIRVTGVFSRDCSQHGGDIDIHCSRFETVSAGNYIGEDIETAKVFACGILVVLSALALFYYFKKLKRKQGNK
jgi:hypothetical protein